MSSEKITREDLSVGLAKLGIKAIDGEGGKLYSERLLSELERAAAGWKCKTFDEIIGALQRNMFRHYRVPFILYKCGETEKVYVQLLWYLDYEYAFDNVDCVKTADLSSVVGDLVSKAHQVYIDNNLPIIEEVVSMVEGMQFVDLGREYAMFVYFHCLNFMPEENPMLH